MPADFQCAQCNHRFSHHSVLKRHMETHMITGDWLCALCNTLVNRYSALTHHWRNSCSELKEMLCEDELKHMPTEDLREVAFRYTLDRYSMRQESDAPTSHEDSQYYSAPEKSSICTFCHLHVPRGCKSHHLKAHTLRRAVGKTIKNCPISHLCDLCGFGFRYKESLITHWREKCSELRAYFKEPTEVDNRCLKEIVLSILKRAEVFTPMTVDEIDIKREEEDVETDSESERANGVDETSNDCNLASSDYSAIIMPSDASNRSVWNVDGDETKPSCSQCLRTFYSKGRLQSHVRSFHSSPKAALTCDLCQAMFKHHRILIKHLRESCRAMKVEEPDEKKRRAMTKKELMEVVEQGKAPWKEMFEKRKQSNLLFIIDFLNDLDRRREGRDLMVPILLDPPASTNSTSLLEPISQKRCDVCKVTFHDYRFLKQHIDTVHPPKCARNQITITTSSLLPYFKLNEASFFDGDGNEYKLGKYLEMNGELTKTLKSRVIKSGTTMEFIGGRSSLIVEVQGAVKTHVVLNEQEFSEVCDSNGQLKPLFAANPKEFDDIPILERQVV